MPHRALLKPVLAAAAAMVALSAIFLSAGSLGAQIPPTPTPVVIPTVRPTPVVTAPGQFQTPPAVVGTNVSICGYNVYQATGGQTISDSTGALQVTLSDAGLYRYADRIVNGQPTLNICQIVTNSSIAISTATGREAGRSVRDGAGHEMMNRILAGARLVGGFSSQASTSAGVSAGPQSQQQVPSALSQLTGIRPPSTGDGGLR